MRRASGACETWSIAVGVETIPYKRDILIAEGTKRSNGELTSLGFSKVEIAKKLILTECTWITKDREPLAAQWLRSVNRLGRGDKKAAIRKFVIQQRQSGGVDVGAIRKYCYAAQLACLTPKQCAESGGGSVLLLWGC